MRDSVHDNWLYAHTIDHERSRIVLHTIYPHGDPWEYTDVVFEGVVANHFEQQLFEQQQNLGGEYPTNLLFGVEETDGRFILGQYEELLRRTKGHQWPVREYDGLDDLVSQLTKDGARCFEVHGVVGLHGFVFAHSMQLEARTSRAESFPAM